MFPKLYSLMGNDFSMFSMVLVSFGEDNCLASSMRLLSIISPEIDFRRFPRSSTLKVSVDGRQPHVLRVSVDGRQPHVLRVSVDGRQPH